MYRLNKDFQNLIDKRFPNGVPGLSYNPATGEILGANEPEQLEIVRAMAASFDPLPGAKAAAREMINAVRDRRYYGTFSHEGSAYDIDSESRSKMNGVTALVAAGVLPGVVWRDHDNVNHAFGPAEWMALVGALAGHSQALYEASWTKKAELEQLPDAEAVATYDVAAGWPV